MVSSEAAPFAKTGGLADVVGALPSALDGVRRSGRGRPSPLWLDRPENGAARLGPAVRPFRTGHVRDHHLPGARPVPGLPGGLPGPLRPQGVLRRKRARLSRQPHSLRRLRARGPRRGPQPVSYRDLSLPRLASRASSPPTCAPPSPPTRPSWVAGPSSPFTTWATRVCSRKPRSGRSRWSRPCCGPTAWNSSAG